MTPLGRDDTYVDLAPSFDCKFPGPRGPSRTMRYEQVSLFLSVAIGDTLQEAEDAYPEMECGIANEGTEYVRFPYCAGELGPSKYIWFGGNPINTIQMNNERFR